MWLAIALGRLPTTNLIWHIWGADLYEMATSWKFKLFYPFRRVAQQKSYRFGQQEAIWIICGEICVQDQNRII
nr:TDP-N-acetylfucosamine:lipid II N-acetylfucosaminyltransferase [Mannheimia haemolytica]